MRLITKSLNKVIIEQDIKHDLKVESASGDMIFVLGNKESIFKVNGNKSSIIIEFIDQDENKVKLTLYNILDILGQNSLKDINTNSYVVITFNDKTSSLIESYIYDKKFTMEKLIDILKNYLKVDNTSIFQGIIVSNLIGLLEFVELFNVDEKERVEQKQSKKKTSTLLGENIDFDSYLINNMYKI